MGLTADLRNSAGTKALFERVSGIAIAVNNLGVFEAKPFFKISDVEEVANTVTYLASLVATTSAGLGVDGGVAQSKL